MKQHQLPWKAALLAQLGTPEGEARLDQLNSDQALLLLKEALEQPKQHTPSLGVMVILLVVFAIGTLFFSGQFWTRAISTTVSLLVFLVWNLRDEQARPTRERLLLLLRQRALEPRATQNLSILLFLAQHSPLEPREKVDTELWKALTLRLSMVSSTEAAALTQAERDFLVQRLNALCGVEVVEQQQHFVAAVLLVLAASGDPRAPLQAGSYQRTTNSFVVREATQEILQHRA